MSLVEDLGWLTCFGKDKSGLLLGAHHGLHCWIRGHGGTIHFEILLVDAMLAKLC
jgi:hypothetical protein